MKNVYFLILLSVMFLFSGCAMGPLVVHESARTVGDSNHELIAGYGQPGYVVKWNYGLSDNLDLGLQWESLSVGIRAKYAFINSQSGFSLAAALGTGTSIGGSHYYGDFIVSYLADSFEPYGTVRLVHVKNDPVKFKDEKTGQIQFTVNEMDYDYGQYVVGTRYWFSPHWLFSVEASSLSAISKGLVIQNSVIVGAGFGYRF